MENTVKNMELIISEIDKQLEHIDKDYKGIKALSHSYESLLSQLYAGNEDFNNHRLTKSIENQLLLVTLLKNNIDRISIPKLLKAGDYLNVNHLTTTTGRLNTIINGLNNLLEGLYRLFNKNVLIIGERIESTSAIVNTVIKDDRIIKEELKFNGKLVITNTINLRVCSYGTHLLGCRFDEVFIDSNLSSDVIELSISLIDNKNNIHMF